MRLTDAIPNLMFYYYWVCLTWVLQALHNTFVLGFLGIKFNCPVMYITEVRVQPLSECLYL